MNGKAADWRKLGCERQSAALIFSESAPSSFGCAGAKDDGFLFAPESDGCQQRGEERNAAADQIRQHRDVNVKRRGEERADDARQRPGTLADADGRTLLVGRREIRKQAELILIGGQTARIEPYSKTPVPLVVVTRTPGNIGSAAKNPIHRTMNSSPIEAVATLIEAGYKSILIEGGVNFLRELIRQQVLDGLYVTHANAEGSENHFDLELLTSDYAVESIEDSDGESFFTYKRINH